MGYLTISYTLDTTTKEKPVLNVDDIYRILHHHCVHNWSKFPYKHHRIQLALMILIQSYTATRRRVFAYVPINKERIEAHYIGQNKDVDLSAEWNPEEDDFRTVSYRDVKLFLLPNPGAPKGPSCYGNYSKIYQKLGPEANTVCLPFFNFE
ncbi:hypothetical protein B0H66DRAFT_273051 [Apodospora peruviana]|uniref:Uncharacterized protein n=1 Tax=Apodospora peruviana TaxID=516989 RepID=A0AAE0M1Q9_9PEZI|nr:hypothetical protein B0H66DRAFT_273051 [Apodospora peruviana]